MKTILKAVLCILVFAVSVEAASYTVKPAGGNFSTIQACANAMSAGDTCTVFAGTYNENVTVTAGTAGNYKTLTVNPGDTVYVYSFTINSYDKINGFSIQNPSSPNAKPCVSVSSLSTNYFITNNNMTACGGSVSAIYEPASTTGTSYGYIGGNTIYYTCSTPAAPNVCNAIVVVGNYTLVENNDISHTTNGVRDYGRYNVIRKNTFHDIRGTNLTPNDCGSNSSNCHIVFVQADADTKDAYHPPTQYGVIENNTQLNALGNDTKFSLMQAENCQGQCFNAIFRFNVGAHVGSGSILDDNSLSRSVPGWSHVKSYNNSWIDYSHSSQPSGGETINISNGSTNGAVINDLFYYPEILINWNPYAADASSAPFTSSNNLAYCTVSCVSQLWGHSYGGPGLFMADSGNKYADPQFVNYSGGDFSLQATSPALNAGTHLTTVASADAGSGTSLVVNDADFFQDGYGINGVQPDCISVTTVSNHACITAVNYSTKTLTLATSITRSAGAPVWLYSDSTGRTVLIGNAPNIGATFDSASVPAPPPPPPLPAPPTGLAAVVN
jgi:hypothetical protein